MSRIIVVFERQLGLFHLDFPRASILDDNPWNYRAQPDVVAAIAFLLHAHQVDTLVVSYLVDDVGELQQWLHRNNVPAAAMTVREPRALVDYVKAHDDILAVLDPNPIRAALFAPLGVSDAVPLAELIMKRPR